jgi:hypothetical protein
MAVYFARENPVSKLHVPLFIVFTPDHRTCQLTQRGSEKTNLMIKRLEKYIQET